jgi:APA family basic amino acid/polyamine antiporter
VTSLFVVISLASSIVAMTLAGPRVAAAMAAEGFLPPALAGRAGRPPMASVLLQGAVALALLATNSFEPLLRAVGAILTLNSALAVVAVLRLGRGGDRHPRPSAPVVVAALVFLSGSVWMLWYTLTDDPRTLLWLAVVVVAAAVGYARAARRRLQ